MKAMKTHGLQRNLQEIRTNLINSNPFEFRIDGCIDGYRSQNQQTLSYLVHYQLLEKLRFSFIKLPGKELTAVATSWNHHTMLPLREKCTNTEFFWSVFSHVRIAYGPEKTPYLDTFQCTPQVWWTVRFFFLHRHL